jgi:hypothetical protein
MASVTISLPWQTLAPSAASIAGKIQYVQVRHPNANYVRMEHFLLNRTHSYSIKKRSAPHCCKSNRFIILIFCQKGILYFLFHAPPEVAVT